MSGSGRIEGLLAERIGLDPSTVGDALIAHAIDARIKATGLGDPASYLALLLRDDRELDELVETVVVPESWFFRDRLPFDLVSLQAPAWLDADRPPLRALSLPCARGEEPYSIAITLLEAGLTPDRFRVDAVDVSARALERARRGVFGPGAFREPDVGHRDRYFHPHAEGFEVDRQVRESVHFCRGNLLDPGLLSDRPPYDLIFCRNVLIYLDAPARSRAIAVLDRLLAGTGLLFVGHAEMLTQLAPRFVPTRDRGSFALRRPIAVAAPARPPAALPAPSRPAPKRSPAPVIPPRPTPPAAPAIRAAVAPEPLPPAPAPAMLDEAAALANLRRFGEAAQLCERQIQQSGPSGPAYYLLGTIHQAAGDDARAEASFQKAVYLDGRHDEALLALALLAERRGDSEASARYRRRAGRALAGEGET